MAGSFIITVRAQDLYEATSIQEMKIYFPYTNWDQKLDSLHSADSDARLVCSYILLNGQKMDSVGIRYKGNSTYNATRNKNPFNIKLDHVKSDQNYQGYKTIKLSNCFMDPSMLREVMGYYISRQYTPASQANFMKVYVNDSYIGLYTNVEAVSSDFLSRKFYSSDGAFFQCDRTDKQVTVPGSCQPANPGSALRYSSSDSACYYNAYELQSDYGWASLLSMMNRLNNNVTVVDQVLNVDRALWMLALNNFFVNLDSYSGSGHNYLVYEDDHGIFQSIMWDLNEFYGAFTNTGQGQATIAQMRSLDPLLHLNNVDRPLISKLLSIPSYKKRYLAHLKTIMTETQANNFYKAKATEWQNLIRSSAIADKNKFFPDSAFELNVNNDYALNNGPNGAKTYPGLTKFATERSDFLKSHVSLNVIQPAIESYTPQPNVFGDSIFFQLTAKVVNADNVYLYYRFSPADPFIRIEMQDNGITDDGVASNQIYGNSIHYKALYGLQYYIYAENASIAVVLPQRAEYEFFTQTPVYTKVSYGGLLINEAMSSNSSYATDPQGDFDDWIEIYNPGDDKIALSGLYLSDNSGNKLKWGFPDTSIGRQSYLVVWADEDGSDPGLHANFKLSRSGEKIHLVNYDSSLIDELDIPELQEDESFGRCNQQLLHFKNPTIGKANSCPSNTSNEKLHEIFQITPNPSFGTCILHLNSKGKYQIRCIGLGGVILEERELNTEVNGSESFQLQFASAGCYLVTVQDHNGFKQSIKVISLY
ncbi:MAG TPA: CotH kinase family protein [Saprospiraceae bacterium]|nr:CotH kinase family protein [Saprospiraceae bacterium]